jgi:hypothetical protein
MVRFQPQVIKDLIPIDDVRQHPDNPNNGDVEAVMESMTINGVYGRVLVQRSTGYIIAGNTRYAALLGLGADQIPVEYADYNDEESIRVLLADNRTNRLGRDDPALLKPLFDRMLATDRGLFGTGWDADAIMEMGNERDQIPDFPVEPAYRRNLTMLTVVCEKIEDARDLAAELIERGYEVTEAQL